MAFTREDGTHHWYSSPEQKALETARFLTSQPVQVVDGLRELRRGRWREDYEDTVRRAFREPSGSPAPGWESAHEAVARFDGSMRLVARAHPGEDIAVVTHGLVLSLWRTRLRRAGGTDLSEWRSLRFPDLLVLSDRGVSAWLADHEAVELERFPDG